ncbi:hypothetical protein NLU13_1872 [Sarocladium strictum]|uniref:Uncharacterized protein n=1 Tax=Sarocladium strictum TaxID=5046 RepID=A0AA39GRT1_SARSR|nr:hypothetical protein NLU13_1872 [Sarocladium strictum]
MDSLEGVMLIPPDRGQLLGRAVWKARYVVAGRKGITREQQNSPSYAKLTGSSRASQSVAKISTEDYCLSIYKTKPPVDRQDNWEPTHQWPLSSVVDCSVQTVAHRKQGPVLPTLIVTISDQQRKRRSSRAAGLITSNKESSSTTVLWFRSPNDEPHVSLHEWVRFIMSRRGAPMSPDSPMSPVLTNPFAPKPREGSDYFPRPSSHGRGLQHKASTATYSTSGAPRERPLTFSSESPSLRSKRSDVSSPSSFNYPVQQSPFSIPGQHYTTVLPTDIPSPTTVGPADYQGEFIEGWTSAQGRSSTVSSPTRGRDSISSHAHQPSVTESSSPPAPRETILDRAFQLRCIPGSDADVPGEEKLSSLARFDALMKEADEKRKQRESAQRAEQAAMRSTFEADDSSDEEDVVPESDTDTENSDAYSNEGDGRSQPSLIPPTTKRALKFIASRHDLTGESDDQVPTRRPMSRNPVSFHGGIMSSLTQAPPSRPHTAHAKSRPNQAGGGSGPASPPLPASATERSGLSSATNVVRGRPSEEGTVRPSIEKRQSSSSAKRPTRAREVVGRAEKSRLSTSKPTSR